MPRSEIIVNSFGFRCFLINASCSPDRRMSVLVATDRMTEDRQRPEFVDQRAQSGMNQLDAFGSVVHRASLRDVRRRQSVVAEHPMGGTQITAGLRAFVSPVQYDVRRIVVQFRQGNAKLVRYVPARWKPGSNDAA